ncbi:MAG: hypothetical protein HY822_15955 [Acidobacteria bacterium]|nr:hypothetical protein [Acidobacteriota bacterium]
MLVVLLAGTALFRRPSGRVPRTFFPVLAAGFVAALASGATRTSIDYVSYSTFAAIPLMAAYAATLSSNASRRLIATQSVIGLFLATTLAALMVFGTWRETPAGRVCVWSKDEAAALDALRQHVKSGQSGIVFPYAPQVYWMAGIHPISPLLFYQPGVHTSRDVDAVRRLTQGQYPDLIILVKDPKGYFDGLFDLNSEDRTSLHALLRELDGRYPAKASVRLGGSQIIVMEKTPQPCVVNAEAVRQPRTEL